METRLMCNRLLRRISFALACLVIIAGCASFETPSKPAAVPEVRPGILAGYLTPKALPNSLALLPPPPSQTLLLSHWMGTSIVRPALCAVRHAGSWRLKMPT
jgi:hypothetical protein